MGNFTKSLIVIWFFGKLFCSCSLGDIELSTTTVNQRFEQSQAWNNCHSEAKLSVTSADYQLLGIADVHVGDTVTLHKFVEIVNGSNADAVIGAGDMVNGNVSEYDAFERLLTYQLPAFFVAGNHDMHFDGWVEYYKRFGSSSYCVTIETSTAKDLLIFLDTGSGTIGDKQLVWLKNILETRRPNYRNCIVISHLDLIRSVQTEATTAPVEEIRTLTDLFALNRVNLVVSGHEHQHSSEAFGNTKYLVMDALLDSDTDPFVETGRRGSESGYLELNVRGGNITSHFRKLIEKKTDESETK
jgi:predicted phosphodiesterase